MMKSLSPGREYAVALAVGAAGAGLVLLSVGHGWADVVTPAQTPLPASSVSVSGQDLVPVADALGLAALAGLAGVIATKRRARQAVGVALAVFGVITVAAVSAHVSAADVLAASHGTAVSQAGSAIAGSDLGTHGGAVAGESLPGVSAAAHVVAVSFPWRWMALLGGLLMTGAGVLVAWRGGRWPTMSGKYDAPTGGDPQRVTDSATLWESLSRGTDPTDHSGWEPGVQPESGDGHGVRASGK